MTTSNGVAGCARRAERVDARLPAVGGDDDVAVELERVAQRLEQQRIVVDDQDAQPRRRRLRRAAPSPARPARRGTGKLRRTVVPCPSALSISISAPCRCTMP